jgi:hypothetical protein
MPDSPFSDPTYARRSNGRLHFAGKSPRLDGRCAGSNKCIGAGGERRPSSDDIVNQHDGEASDAIVRLDAEGSRDVRHSLFRSQVDLRVSSARANQPLLNLDSYQITYLLGET